MFMMMTDISCNHESDYSHLDAGIDLRSRCIPPVNTVPHSGQITMHSTCQHSTTQWSDHQAFHLTTQYHSGQITMHSTCQHSTTLWSDHQSFQLSTQYRTVVRSPGIPPVNTIAHGQITRHSTCQHGTTQWSD